VRVIGNAVVLWQEPAEPNGINTGYEVGISTTHEPTPDQIMTVRCISDTEQNFIIESVDSICRDSVDMQYMLIQTNFSKSPKQLTYKPL